MLIIYDVIIFTGSDQGRVGLGTIEEIDLLQTLKVRLVLISAILLVLLASILFAISFTQMRSALIDSSDAEIISLADGESALMSSWLSTHVRDVSGLAEETAQPDLQRMIDRQAETSNFEAIGVAFEDGRYLLDRGKTVPAGFEPRERHWYLQSKSSGEAGLTKPYIDALTKKLTVTVTVPFKQSGAFAGSIAADVLVDKLFSQLAARKVRADGFVFLLDKDGTIVSFPKAEYVQNPVTKVAPALTIEKISSMTGFAEGSAIELDGREMIVALRPVAGSDWLVGVAMDQSQLDAPMTRLGYLLAGATLGTLLLLVVLGGGVIGRMLAGLLQLRDAMREIAQGDADLTRALPVKGRDEIAQTAEAFNAFVAGLRTLFVGLRGEAGSVVSGINGARHLVGEVACGSRALSDVSSANAATLEEITVSISQIADGAQQADALVHATQGKLDTSAQGISRICLGMESTAGSVRSLGRYAVLSERSLAGDFRHYRCNPRYCRPDQSTCA